MDPGIAVLDAAFSLAVIQSGIEAGRLGHRFVGVETNRGDPEHDGPLFDELRQGATNTVAGMIGVNREDLDESMIGRRRRQDLPAARYAAAIRGRRAPPP